MDLTQADEEEEEAGSVGKGKGKKKRRRGLKGAKALLSARYGLKPLNGSWVWCEVSLVVELTVFLVRLVADRLFHTGPLHRAVAPPLIITIATGAASQEEEGESGQSLLFLLRSRCFRLAHHRYPVIIIIRGRGQGPAAGRQQGQEAAATGGE